MSWLIWSQSSSTQNKEQGVWLITYPLHIHLIPFKKDRLGYVLAYVLRLLMPTGLSFIILSMLGKKVIQVFNWKSSWKLQHHQNYKGHFMHVRTYWLSRVISNKRARNVPKQSTPSDLYPSCFDLDPCRQVLLWREPAQPQSREQADIYAVKAVMAPAPNYSLSSNTHILCWGQTICLKIFHLTEGRL